MVKKSISIISVILSLGPPMHSQATELYKCEADGKVNYQRRPCEASQDETIFEVGGQPEKANKPSSNFSSPSVATPARLRDAKGRIVRSEAAKKDFKVSNPCPANGHRSGACPGYVIDHITPLACGGADAPSNMQWQTIAEGKAKDKWERDGCDVGRD